MMDLSNQDKELILDYCLGIAPKEQVPYVEGLIASNPEGARIYAALRGALSPLEAIQGEVCPDKLVNQTVARLKDAAAQDRLEHLLEAEGGRPTIRLGWWRNWSQVAAVAAIVVFAVGVMIPSFGFARSLYFRNRCQMQLAQIYDGISTYSGDHDGRLPAVATADGSPWWKVGYQGRENHSNTRPVWQLVRQGYVDPARFLCPGSKERPAPGKVVASDYNDFPDKRYDHYSFRISCDKLKNPGGLAALMADRNPLSERLPADFSAPLKLRLDQIILNSNSINHRRSGQNILMGNGSVRFAKTRMSGVAKDDIFSTTTMICGFEVKGCETPSCASDDFLAP
jgi:hypothetical protein